MTSIIAAYSTNRVIGNDNAIPWKMSDDMNHFRKVTDGSTVIMGRNTYQSLLDTLGGALPNRRNIVVSKSLIEVEEGFEVVDSLEKALGKSNALSEQDEVFIIGGSQLYAYALEEDLVDQMYITEIHGHVAGDAYFPEYDKGDWLEVSRVEKSKDAKNNYDYAFTLLIRSASA
jgi:dihydrofolate reductase